MTDPQPAPEQRSTVKGNLTRKRRKRHVENDEYADFLRRALAAYGRRVADGDIDALTSFNALVTEAQEQLGEAVFFLRVRGYSWAEIGLRLGVTRQAAQQRWGKPAMTPSTAPNGALKSGARITWTQYRTLHASGNGRERSGWFWALAPGRNAIWVKPETREPGEPVAIKVYRTVHSRSLTADAAAYDDDLTAA